MAGYFNSSIVRLKVDKAEVYAFWIKTNFNSSIVRLKVALSNLKLKIDKRFQFKYCTIKRLMPTPICIVRNSISIQVLYD